MNPLFQHAYVLTMQNIFLFGLIIASIVTILLKRKNSPYFFTSLPLFVLTFHQVDEYIISPFLFGETYHFLNWAYRSGLEISPAEVVLVNGFVYIPALILYLFKPSTKLFALIFLFVNSATLANGAFHLGVATLQTDYSPGMLTALFLFIPLFIKSILLASERLASFRLIFALSSYGFILHFVMIWLVNIY
ncbi:MAG: HXXEE domain-containing protein [Pseudomonadota bacterium]|nr:HXXEE domain-containing protein [Pseudomonadota bacterium]